MRKKKHSKWSFMKLVSDCLNSPKLTCVCLPMPGCSKCWRRRIHSLPVSSPDATKKSVHTMPSQYKVFSKEGALQKLNSHSTTELKLNSTNYHKFQLSVDRTSSIACTISFWTATTFAVLKVVTGATLAVMARPHGASSQVSSPGILPGIPQV